MVLRIYKVMAIDGPIIYLVDIHNGAKLRAIIKEGPSSVKIGDTVQSDEWNKLYKGND